MAKKPSICGDCAEILPGRAAWPALAVLGGRSCEVCDKLLCPQCIRVDVAGAVYCEECAEAAEVEVGQVCVVCGCSQLAGCEGGCHWVHDVDAGEAPRCSRCVNPAGSGTAPRG